MAENKTGSLTDVGLKPVCFPEFNSVPLYGSQQTSRSLSVLVSVSLSLPLSVKSHIQHC